MNLLNWINVICVLFSFVILTTCEDGQTFNEQEMLKRFKEFEESYDDAKQDENQYVDENRQNVNRNIENEPEGSEFLDNQFTGNETPESQFTGNETPESQFTGSETPESQFTGNETIDNQSLLDYEFLANQENAENLENPSLDNEPMDYQLLGNQSIYDEMVENQSVENVTIDYTYFNTAYCEQPREFGPCLKFFLRWYYDKPWRKCKQFVYSGCGGNDNNFLTKEECLEKCKPRPKNFTEWLKEFFFIRP